MDPAPAAPRRTRRTVVIGLAVFVVSLPLMYALGWPLTATAGLFFWTAPTLVGMKLGPLLFPPPALGEAFPKVDGSLVVLAALTSLQNGLLAAALARGTAARRVITAAVVLVAIPACILLGMFAVNRWVPPTDRSAQIEQTIRSRYESEVADFEIRRLRIQKETDVPWAMTYTAWAYEVEYRLAGVPLTIRWQIEQDDKLTGAPFERPGVRDPDYSGVVHGVFPDDVGLTEQEFRAVLNAYAEGSGQTEFGSMIEVDPWADVGATSGTMSFAVWRRASEYGPPATDTRDKYIVDFDLASREASYAAGSRRH